MRQYSLIGFLSFILSFSLLVATPKAFANGFYPQFDICDILPFLCEEEEEDQVTICHHTESEENPWVEITINENAWEAHSEHGDFLVDEEYVCPPQDEEEEPTPTPTEEPEITPTPTEEPEEQITPTPTPEVVVDNPVTSSNSNGEVGNNPPVCNGVYASSAVSGTGHRVDSDTVVMEWWPSSSPHDSQILWYGSQEGNYPYSVIVPAGIGIQELNDLPWTGHTWARVDTVWGNCVTEGISFDP